MSKNQFVGRDSFYRMKYLYQISDICRQKPGDDYTKLMLHYGSQLVSIGKKTQSRMLPKMKRTICKVCNAILAPGDTESLSLAKIKGQPNKLISTCIICGAEKKFNLRKDYKLWCEKPESIVKVFDACENKKNDSILVQSTYSKCITSQSSIEALKSKVNCKKNNSNVKLNSISDLKTSKITEDESFLCLRTKDVNNVRSNNTETKNRGHENSIKLESKSIFLENVETNVVPEILEKKNISNEKVVPPESKDINDKDENNGIQNMEH